MGGYAVANYAWNGRFSPFSGECTNRGRLFSFKWKATLINPYNHANRARSGSFTVRCA